MFVYLIKNNVNGKCYVGQTSYPDVQRRWNAHCSLRRSMKTTMAIGLAIAKYGKDNFTFSILAECKSRQELDELEVKYIKEHNSVAPNGYNLESGGTSGYTFHEDTLKKMSEAKLGKPLTEETKAKMSEAHKKRWVVANDKLSKERSRQTKKAWQDPEYRARIVETQIERWKSEKAREEASIKAKKSMTDEQRALISDKVKESMANNEEARAKLAAVHKRQQKQVVDELGNVFESLKAAAAHYGMNGTSAIIKQIKGRYKTAGGHTFKYVTPASNAPASSDKDEPEPAVVKPIIYLVSGVSGSGKSWVCEQLLDKFTYVSYDREQRRDHLDLLKATTGKPKLYDPSIKISTFIRRYSHLLDIRPVFIVENESVIRDRLETRGGVFTDYAPRRMKVIASRAAKYGVFSGTSSEVLDYLKSVVV